MRPRDEVARGGWGDGVAAELDALAAGAAPDVVGGERHAGGDLVGFEHPEEAVVDLGLGGLDVAGGEEGLVAGRGEGPHDLVGGGEHLGAVALAGVVPLDQGVPVDRRQRADGLARGLPGQARPGAVVRHQQAGRLAGRHGPVRLAARSRVVVPRAASGDDEGVVVAGRGDGRHRVLGRPGVGAAAAQLCDERRLDDAGGVVGRERRVCLRHGPRLAAPLGAGHERVGVPGGLGAERLPGRARVTRAALERHDERLGLHRVQRAEHVVGRPGAVVAVGVAERLVLRVGGVVLVAAGLHVERGPVLRDPGRDAAAGLVGQRLRPVTDPLAAHRPVDRSSSGEVAGLHRGAAAGVEVDVLGAVLPDGAAVLPHLLRLDHALAGRAPREGPHHLVDVGCTVALEPAHDVEPVAGLGCGVAVRLGVHGVEGHDAEVVAEVREALLPQRPRLGELRVAGDVDDVLDDHRGVAVVLGEAEDVEHQEPGSLHDRRLGVLVDQVGVEEVEEVGLGRHRGVLPAGCLRPLRALG
jgi:hypothetical protein